MNAERRIKSPSSARHGCFSNHVPHWRARHLTVTLPDSMSQPSPLPVIDLPARPALPSVLNRMAFWAVFGIVVIAALAAGLVLRRYAWDETEPIRYTLDINNAFRQG